MLPFRYNLFREGLVFVCLNIINFFYNKTMTKHIKHVLEH